MTRFNFYIFMLICMMEGLVSEQPTCSNNLDTSQALKISFSSRKNETGQWTDVVTAQAIVNETLDNVAVNVTQSAITCDGKRVITIRGTSGAVTPNDAAEDYTDSRNQDKLLFHRRCGVNVVVINGGRTVRKKTESNNTFTVSFTNRPLKDNEIFQVRLNEISEKRYMQIGVINETPEKATIVGDMYRSSNAWVCYGSSVCVQGNCVTRTDGLPLTELKIGETLGVMRSKSGDLHWFFDGVDMGVVANNVPSTVHGMFELYSQGQRATIV